MSSQLRNRNGKFIRTKELLRREKARIICAQRRKDNRQNNTDDNREGFKIPLSQLFVENCVVESAVSSERLQCSSCKSALLVEDNTVDDTRKDENSALLIKCRSCQMLVVKHHNITTDILGTKKTGFSKILACTDVLSIPENVYKRYQRKMGPAIEVAARKSCRKVASEERKFILEKLQELQDHIPFEYREEYTSEMMKVTSAYNTENTENFDSRLGAIVNIIVSHDVGLSECGHSSAYNSSSGYGAMIGFLTGKLEKALNAGRRCSACDKLIREKEHVCRLDFFDSAKTNAEKEIISNREILEDEDSSFVALKNSENSEQTVHKLADTNRCSENIPPKLCEVQKNHCEKNGKGLVSHARKCSLIENKEDHVELEKQTSSLPQNSSSNQEDCGGWSHKKIWSNRGFDKQELIITSPELIQAIEDLLIDYADNAEKYSVSECGQKSYGKTELGDLNIDASVLEKDEDESYLLELTDTDSNQGSSPYSREHCTRLDIKISKKIEEPCKKDNNVEKVIDKRKRDHVHTESENKQRGTYKQNVILKFNGPQIKMTENRFNKNFLGTFTLVYFGIETSGKSNDAEILQITAVSDRKTFSVHVQPTKVIGKSVTAINGLHNIGGNLYLRNKKLNTSSITDALKAFSNFLNGLEGKTLIITHNAYTHVNYLLRDIVKYSLLEYFENTIYGFTDTLEIFRVQFPEWKLGKGKGMFNLAKLASQLLKENLSKANFYDATHDIFTLQKLVNNHLPITSLLHSAVKLEDVLSNFIQKAITWSS